MENLDIVIISNQLKLLQEKKENLLHELDNIVKERDIIFDQYSSQYSKRDYLSMMVKKLKDELQFDINEKEKIELSLAYLIVKKMLHKQNDNDSSELLPADAEYFLDIEINDKEAEIKIMNNEINRVRNELTEAEKKLDEFLFDKTLTNTYRDICKRLQLAQKAYNDAVKIELQTAQQLLEIYRKIN